MLLFSPRWLFLYPGLLMLVVSSMLYFSVLAGTVWLGTFGFDIHTLFYAQTGMTLGLISSVFGVTARMFGMREGFLSEHRLLEAVRRSPVLEIGEIMGLLLIAIGVYLGLDLLAAWGEADLRPAELWRVSSHGQRIHITFVFRRNYSFLLHDHGPSCPADTT